MQPSDYISLGALAIAIIALTFSLRADRRASEKHEYELDTTWRPEWAASDLSDQHEIRFRCNGPRQIEHAWINTDSLFLSGYAPHIVSITPGSYLSSGETISFTIANLRNISALPDRVEISWRYVLPKSRLVLGRVRRLFAPAGYSDATHSQTVDVSDVLHELQDEAAARETKETQPPTL